MLAEWQIQDLLQLMRRRYRGWEDFGEPAFVADEIAYKRATAAKFAELFSQAECDRLIGVGEYEPFLERLEKLCLDNNLLWRRVPSAGETAVFHHPALDKPTFCTQVRNLLYADRPSPARLQSFSDYLTTHHLPNKWPLPTYLLFMCQPGSEFLVRSAPIEWFLKFMGAPQKVRGVPDSAVYDTVLDKARTLLRELRLYGARDMIDVQSFVWVCAKEARGGIERLSPKAQIELDVPQTTSSTIYQITKSSHFIQEPENSTMYEAGEQMNLSSRPLAKPFKDIFNSWDEANWAFDFWQKIIPYLGIRDLEGDKRFALTLPSKYKGRLVRINFGQWVISDFRKDHLGQIYVRVLLIEAEIPPEYLTYVGGWTFSQSAKEPMVRSCLLPLDTLRQAGESVLTSIERTYRFIAERFENWHGSPYRGGHIPQIMTAVFDPDYRQQLFQTGLQEPNPFEQLAIVEDENQPEPYPAAEKYTLEICAKDINIPETELSRWLQALERKKQAVFYGPPGTGKTFVAQKIAQHLVSESDGLVELVQFHPAYAYEDFMQGIRPFTINGTLEYQLTPGRFLQFCAKAQARTGPCILIIDEINRANLASVFGELMYLLEYRQQEIPLAGGGRFSIPTNVRILGTMNTADRSIALVDHALRRRFAFIHLPPNYDLLRHHHTQTNFPIESLITLLKDLNTAIDDPHYHVGHSFFLRPNLAQDLEDIWRMEIEPYLEEYFFSQTDHLKNFRWAQIAKRILT